MSAAFGYKTYSGTLAADLQIDILTDLGSPAQGGFIINDDAANSFQVQFAYNSDGVTASFGDLFTLKPGERLVIDGLGFMKAVNLVFGASALYRILFSASRSTIQ
jgi:hypothetical protein